MSSSIRWINLATAVAAPTAAPALATDGIPLDSLSEGGLLHIAVIKSAALIAAGGAITVRPFLYSTDLASWLAVDTFVMALPIHEAEPLLAGASSYNRCFVQVTAIVAGTADINLGQG